MIEVILFRFLFALFILPYPLFGGILSATAEFVDLDILLVVEPEAFPLYQYLDKTLDLFYLGLEAYIASSWKNKTLRDTALVLFTLRFIGTILFYIFHNPLILVLFPNVFEWFYLSVLILLRFNKEYFLIKYKNVINLIAILLCIKLVHEYYLHVFLPAKIHPEAIQNIILYFSNLTS